MQLQRLYRCKGFGWIAPHASGIIREETPVTNIATASSLDKVPCMTPVSGNDIGVMSGRRRTERGRKGKTVDSDSKSVKRGRVAAPLDTLAQPDQNQQPRGFQGDLSPSPSLSPSHTPFQAQQTFQRRGRAKLLTRALSASLASLRTPLERSYRNSVYCCDTISQADGILHTHYCGNRWCLVCSRIRTARAINAYLPVIETWDAPHMVTLTVRNCTGDELRTTIRGMLETFTSCKRAIRRTGGVPFRAVRKLECTYSLERRDYHPHLHVIVEGREAAEMLRALWLRRLPAVAESGGQDVRPCDTTALLELFKYFTKLTTKVGRKGARRVAPLAALDTIFQAMKGRRVWQPVGFTLPKEIEEAIEGEEIEVAGTRAFKREVERVYWQWVQEVADWIDQETGEALAEYTPGEGYVQFVESIGRDDGEMVVESPPAPS